MKFCWRASWRACSPSSPVKNQWEKQQEYQQRKSRKMANRGTVDHAHTPLTPII